MYQTFSIISRLGQSASGNYAAALKLFPTCFFCPLMFKKTLETIIVSYAKFQTIFNHSSSCISYQFSWQKCSKNFQR